MPYTTLVPGTTITASWANTNVRDQTIGAFASTGARDSAITSPVAGMVEYLTTNLATEGLTTRNSAGVWRPPWNMPWGFIADFVPANFNFTTSVGQSAIFTPTLIANRRYMWCVGLEIANQLAVGTIDIVTLFDNVSGTDVGVLRKAAFNNTSFLDAVTCVSFVNSPGAGARGYRIRAISTLSGNAQTIQNISAQLLDVGPSGAPA